MPANTVTADRSHDLRMLEKAARLAVRGHGGGEPNPLVGCVLTDDGGRILAEGHHGRCGGPHAEIEALRRAGPRARGATAYVTLEPCRHTGRTGPCCDALIDAGVRRVVIARLDPSPEAGGGAERLRQAGIAVELLPCPAAERVAAPFAHRVRTGLPWVTVKWAQTIDGRIATSTGESQWISGGQSRRLVHRQRGRVDAVLTGIGTALADDPRLTARATRRRRVARRVLVDPELRLPADAQLVRTVDDAPLTIACARDAADGAAAASLRNAGAELLPLATDGRDLPLAALLRELVSRHEIAHVLVEAGPGLVGRLFREGLVNEAAVFVAPMVLGDASAPCAVTGLAPARLADATSLRLAHVHRRGPDVLLRYDVGTDP
jgi:diaminohydroxyphosphoribosylaminopyrimidine deaminase/5-amino-6-(5-phosphoribosylamino)uracil reductase